MTAPIIARGRAGIKPKPQLLLVASCAILLYVADTVIPTAWTSLSEEGLEGTVMIIGASDTGKSTLARYLYQDLCQRRRCVAYLDADMGQSTLGLPTTLNLALPSEPGDDRFPPRGVQFTFFTGSITPRGHLLPTVVGACRLQRKALLAGAQSIVVDTTGMVDRSQGGKALKQWKIELLSPSVVIGLQRHGELEPILWPLRRDGRVRCIELPVSPHVVERSRQARIARRNAHLARYLEPARPQVVALRQTAVYDMEHVAAGTLVAFQDQEGFMLGLGVVEEIGSRGGTIVARTPLSDLGGVASIRFGSAGCDLANLSY